MLNLYSKLIPLNKQDNSKAIEVTVRKGIVNMQYQWRTTKGSSLPLFLPDNIPPIKPGTIMQANPLTGPRMYGAAYIKTRRIRLLTESITSCDLADDTCMLSGS